MKHVYFREIDPGANDSLATIARKISPHSKVLDVGTGSGALGRYLKKSRCTVDGITYSEEEALQAQTGYDRIEVVNLENTLPSTRFAVHSYDVIVCADILEHLRNAMELLTDLHSLLAPKGRILLSIPNATYMGVLFGLLASRFVRTQEGVLDATHVNFFDRQGLEQLVERAGYRIAAVLDVRKGLIDSEFSALDTLALGEAQAQSLGIDVRRTRLLILFGVALGVGAATAVAGVIGFVGLVAPHLVRPLTGYQPGRALLPAALVGAIFVTLADIATRTIHIGPEIKLGVFISMIGAPFFLWLVLHLRKTAP